MEGRIFMLLTKRKNQQSLVYQTQTTSAPKELAVFNSDVISIVGFIFA